MMFQIMGLAFIPREKRETFRKNLVSETVRTLSIFPFISPPEVLFICIFVSVYLKWVLSFSLSCVPKLEMGMEETCRLASSSFCHRISSPAAGTV
jgi:hypothetical protein